MNRIYASLLSIGMVIAVLLPVAENWKQEPKDSFPLSYYPMFSRAHGEKQTERYIIGLDSRGERRVIHYRHAGGGGANQVRKQLRKVSRRPELAEELLRSVAARIARRQDPALAELEVIQLVRGTYRPQDYFGRGLKDPVKETVVASLQLNHENRTDSER